MSSSDPVKLIKVGPYPVRHVSFEVSADDTRDGVFEFRETFAAPNFVRDLICDAAYRGLKVSLTFKGNSGECIKYWIVDSYDMSNDPASACWFGGFINEDEIQSLLDLNEERK